jgi:recombination protein RecR
VHSLPGHVQKLIDQFVRLPGIGPKTASRLVLFLLHSPEEFVMDFGTNLSTIKSRIRFCSNCYNLAEEELCVICQDQQRDRKKILVVEDILDLMAFENIREYRGLYHVLGGLISPMQGIGPEDLNIGSLIRRVHELGKSEGALEIIVATNPNLEGEATAMYLREEIETIAPEAAITRIARGVPTGADLDYADRVTLLRSLEGRIKL